MSSFWEDVQAAAENDLAIVERFGEELWVAFKAATYTLLTDIETMGGTLFLSVVSDAVTAAETAGGTGMDKFNAAKSIVVADLTSKGLPVVTSAVHAAIEAGVASLNASQAADSAAANTPPAAQ